MLCKLPFTFPDLVLLAIMHHLPDMSQGGARVGLRSFLTPTDSPVLILSPCKASVGSHKLKGSVPQASPHRSQGPPALLTPFRTLRHSQNPFLRFDSTLQRLTEFQKTLVLRFPVYYKGYISGAAKWKSCKGEGVREGGTELPHPPSYTTLPTPRCIHQHGNPQIRLFRGFYEGFVV